METERNWDDDMADFDRMMHAEEDENEDSEDDEIV